MSELTPGSFSIKDIESVRITINNVGAAKEAAEEKAKELVKAGPTPFPGLLDFVPESFPGYPHSVSSLILLYRRRSQRRMLKALPETR